MTTRVTIKNENVVPYAQWNVSIQFPDGHKIELKPQESITETLWHDGRELAVKEVPL